MRVISGSSEWKLANTLTNCGITKMLTIAIAPTIATTTKVG